jgi:hypothetical protein
MPGVVFVANPLRLDAVARGETDPIGFPVEDVFEFEEDKFTVLANQWADHRWTNPQIWESLIPHASY